MDGIVIKIIETPIVDVDYKSNKYNQGDLDIVDATLLSTDEARVLPLRLRSYNNWWWLRSPSIGFINYAALVYGAGSVSRYGNLVHDGDGAVRPALKITNLESSNLKIGDIFKFGGKEFEIISDNLAFCLGDIGKHKFDEKSNDYEISEIKQYVDNWFNSSI